MTDLRTSILQGLADPRPERSLAPLSLRPTRHQALLMLKPEAFLQGEAAAAGVLDIVFDTLAAFGATVDGGVLLDGTVLGRLGTIDRHYKLASQLSRGASSQLSAADRARACEVAEQPEGTPVLGGYELLSLRADLDPDTLDTAWSEARPRKVRSGFYVEPFPGPTGPCVLVNGFYPAQARAFTGPGRTVALLLLHSDQPWKALRRDMLGDTYPDRAAAGSIRGRLLAQKEALGLARVDITANFVHLSAGPFEAAWELLNFFDGLETTAFTLAQSPLARAWEAAGRDLTHLDTLVRTGTWSPEGTPRDLCGDTEELDLEEAMLRVLTPTLA